MLPPGHAGDHENEDRVALEADTAFAGGQRMVADAILAERAAAMFRRRHPGTRPESLDFVIEELGSFAASMRRKAPGRD